MKKQFTILLLSFFLVAITTLSIGQESTVSRYLSTVFAESGLNMRSAPNLKADVILKIPYQAKITLMDNKSFGIDTISVIKTETYKYIIDGHWVKVKYNGKIGYVVSSYLRVDSKTFLKNRNLPEDYFKEKDFILLRPGFDCGFRYVDKRKYHWYGLYTTDSIAEFKPIEFEYVNTTDVDANQGIIAIKNKNLNYIIGSKIKLASQSHPDPIVWKKNVHSITEKYTLDDCGEVNPSSQFYITTDENHYEPGGCHTTHRMYIQYKGVVQETFSDMPGNFIGSKTANFIGDLDGDGDPDYVLYQSNEKTHRDVLFLSSLKNSSYPIAKPAVVNEGGNCY